MKNDGLAFQGRNFFMASDNEEETKYLLWFFKWTPPKSQFDYAKG